MIKVRTIQSDLSRLAVRNERIMLIALRSWFYFINKQIRRDLGTKYAKSVTSELTDWEFIEEEGKDIIQPASIKIIQSGGDKAYKMFRVSGTFSVLNVKAVQAADKFTAKLVREVNEGTKAGIRSYISSGIKDGKSMPKIARELRPLIGLTKNQTESIMNYRKLLEDKGKFPKLTQTDINRKVQRYADKTHRRRAATIARTETARAQNIGYVQGLQEVGVEQVEFSASPGACEICEIKNGDIYSVQEADIIIPVHPNCRCAPLPVLAGKTAETASDVADSKSNHVEVLQESLRRDMNPTSRKRTKKQIHRLGGK